MSPALSRAGMALSQGNMAKQLQSLFTSHCTHEFSIEKDGRELLDLTVLLGKVEIVPTFTIAVLECWNVSGKHTWDNDGDRYQLSME